MTTNASLFRAGAKYIWRLPTATISDATTLAAQYNLSLPVVQALLNRGFADKDQFEKFLFSSYEKDVADPCLMRDAEKAADRLLLAIERKEKILIAGDYDVDGITSSALLLTCLLPLGADINFFLPHRVKDGYGLSVKTITRAADNGYKVIITVDNGITAFEPAVEAKKRGIDLIITDHHRPHDHLPDAFAIVNPHRNDCEYPFKKFAGVGVGFKLMSLIYQRLGKELPTKVYELLLLGTVADVVPLLGENRFWVRYGLQLINKQESFSFKVLKKNARFTKPLVSSTDIGFSITPQINALGRLEDARSGVKFLIGSDPQETEQIGTVLAELNQARRAIELGIFEMVDTQVKNKTIDLDKTTVLIAAHNDWQPGVIGLVASRLVGAYGRPTILLHLTKDGKAKGSCRSIPEINIFEALQACSDLLLTFGGHPMAAGLSLNAENVPLFQERLNAYVAARVTPLDLQQKLRLDAELTLPEANKKLMGDLAYLEPFGCENSAPTFYIKNATLIEAPMLLKDVHVKCSIFADGVIKPVIFFGRPDIYHLLLERRAEPFSLAVSVTENHWNGKVNVEFQGHDISFDF